MKFMVCLHQPKDIIFLDGLLNIFIILRKTDVLEVQESVVSRYPFGLVESPSPMAIRLLCSEELRAPPFGLYSFLELPLQVKV